MTTPVFFAFNGIEQNALTYYTMSTTKFSTLYEKKYNISPIAPSVNAGQNTGMSFFAAQ